MDALTVPADDGTWIPVEDASAAGHVRLTAQRLAAGLGFEDHRVGEVAIAATELATNVYRHAREGMMLLRIRRDDALPALEIVACDRGPGVSNFALLIADGNSSRGTLGIGLGAIVRLATAYDAHSVPGRGTVIVVSFGASPPPSKPPLVGGLVRPMNREAVCGDAWSVRSGAGVDTILLADGLGHGELAAIASREAVRAFAECDDVASPAHVIAHLHRRLAGTRGAAVAALRVDRAAARVRFAGMGNVMAWVDDGERRRALASTPGIVGHHAKSVHDVELPLAPHAVVVMHSDGVTTKWSLNDYPGIRVRGPIVIATTIFRDAAVRHDDASVVVAKAS